MGKNSPDYKKIFGIISGAMAVFGTIGFTALIIEGMYIKMSSAYFQLVWVSVGCMVLGVILVSIYKATKGDRLN